jgi:hypothetical protein
MRGLIVRFIAAAKLSQRSSALLLNLSVLLGVVTTITQTAESDNALQGRFSGKTAKPADNGKTSLKIPLAFVLDLC